MVQRPIAEGLFTLEPRPHLIGGRRKRDGRIVFPAPTGPEGAHYDPVPLKTEGVLWSFTVQRFRPKSPPYAGPDDERTFKPFALGYVELAGQVIVESRIATDDFSALRVGQPMRLVTQSFGKDADGTDIVTFAFEPTDQAVLGAAA
jgi:uncharacterized OB-fold protein